MFIEERLEALENRISKLEETITDICNGKHVCNTIAARRVTLADGDGKTRVLFSIREDERGALLCDERGKLCIMADKERSAFYLYDEEGKLIASLSMAEKGGHLTLYDKTGRPLWFSEG